MVLFDPKLHYNFIVNISEDGWFGNSIGPYQHFAHSIFRSVEYGKYTLRSANNGISAIIDPSGLIIDKLNVDRRFEVIPNTKEKDKDEPYGLDLKLKSQIKETLPQYKDFDIQTNEREPIFSRTCDKLFKKNKLELDLSLIHI